MKTISKAKYLICTTAIASLLLTSCVSVWKIPINSVAYPESEKIQANVQLLITEEFKKAAWEAMVSPLDKGLISIGDDLVKQAEKLARTVFTEVTVANNGSSTQAAAMDAVLVPKVVLFERTQPPTIYGQQTTTLSVEWRLKGRTGETLWVDTIKGQSTTKMGSNPKKSATVQVQAAFDQLFKETYKSMTSSPDVRNIAKKP